MIMLKEPEGSLDHCVLKVIRGVEGRNPARQRLTETQMFGSPSHEFVWTHESCRNSAYRPLTRPFGSQQMHFDTAGKVKAPLNGGSNAQALFN
jgi:hypothetical protein